MANHKKKSGSRTSLASWLWIAAAGGFLIGSIALLAMLLLSGDERRMAALESGQRIEFSPRSGEVQGRLIRLAELDEEAATETPPALPAEPPLPEIDEEAEVLEPVGDFGEENPEEAPAPTPAEEPVKVDVEPEAEPAPPADTSGIAAGAGRDPVQFRTKTGVIPGIAKDGTVPWQFYAQPKPTASGPKVVIVLYGLGLGSLATEAALALPAGVTLSFSPYSRNLEKWIGRARASGHEILLDLPMETDRYPAMDPGPLGILNNMGVSESYQNLLAVLERAEQYVGLLMPIREAISENTDAITSLVDSVSKHGLLLLSSNKEPSRSFSEASKGADAPILHADIVLDTRITHEHINGKLAEMEAIAKKQGFVIAIGRSFPVTVELVGAWSRNLREKGLTLVPLTALAEAP